jgi:acyl dehydratase
MASDAEGRVTAQPPALPEGRITDEAIARIRAMIGERLHVEQYLRDVTLDTITNFSNGIGDVNPLYRDGEYGRWSRFGSIVAHPCLPYIHHWSGRTRWGLRGVHGFFAGNDWEFFRHLRPGDRINCMERILGVEEKESRFSGRLVLQSVETLYTNQRDEVIARVVGWCTRHERQAAREAGKHKAVERHQYTDAEIERIEAAALGERQQVRGRRPRYWEDVVVGEDLSPIVRGPLSLMDTTGFLGACGRIRTHGVLLEEVKRHPAHYFRTPEGGVEYTGMGHHREDVARQVGVPGTYDYGPQRVAWLGSLVTNWMGDEGLLKRLRGDLRGFNVVGDTTWCKGKVARKHTQGRFPLVDVDLWSENQRGETTSKGVATVLLPARALGSDWLVDASGLSLGEMPKP